MHSEGRNKSNFSALYAVESNQNGSESDDNEEYRAVRKISATEEIPDEVKNWLTETFVRTNVIKNIGKLGFGELESESRILIFCPHIYKSVFGW